MLPHYHYQEEFRNRSAKLAKIRALGIDPYPAKFESTHTAQEVKSRYENQKIGGSEEAAAGKTEQVVLAGRMVLFRAMGKNSFAHLQDSSGRIQLMFNRDLTKVEGWNPTEELTNLKFIEKQIDLGDILGVEGHLFRTHKEEVTLYVKKVTLLCKSLLPLPDKHGGLNDKEERYRKRWLDLIAHPNVMATFQLRSRILQSIRRYFEASHFIEVETAILQNIYGGAEACPFTTQLHALHQKMYLRIALETSLKKLIVGGMDKIYEISKVFRNEGIDKSHNPEFTMLEAYAAYWDYNDMMRFCEELFESIAMEFFGTTELLLCRNEKKMVVNLKAPWKRISFKEAILSYAQIDVDQLNESQIRTILLKSGKINLEKIEIAPRGILIAKLFEIFVEHHLIQPHHIIDHPIETTPFCKPHRNSQSKKEGLVERFETFILGYEICNAYSELNDPELQRKLLVEQHEKKWDRQEGVEHPLDEEFLEAICQGMPPTAGIGIGIDRLVMLFSGEYSIRDVLFFPLMRPESN